jgi:hypothetical protein
MSERLKLKTRVKIYILNTSSESYFISRPEVTMTKSEVRG